MAFLGALGTFVAKAVGAIAVAKVLDWLLDTDDEAKPASSTYQARNEVRSEVAVKRWVVGRVRVAGVLIGHADVIVPDHALEWWEANKNNDDFDRSQKQQATNERMELYGYFAYALSEGITDGVRGMWIDGVRMPMAFNENPATLMADGEFGPPADMNPKLEPFYSHYFPLTVEIRGLGDINAQFTQAPAIAGWQHKGTAVDEARLPPIMRKLAEVYETGESTQQQRDDAKGKRGADKSWALVRLRQNNIDGTRRPFRNRPRIDFLMQGKGPPGPQGCDRSLLDGNPARAAYWFLTERMRVPHALIDEVWLQSSEICDERVTASAVTSNFTVTPAEVIALTRRPGLWGVLREIARQLGLDPQAASSIVPAYSEWKRRRYVEVVRRFTGRDFDDVDEGTRKRIVAAWNDRFTGSPDDIDGTRFRYRANGVISSGDRPDQVLRALAQSMAGSIDEHGGRWFIRAGSLSIRPWLTITDEDVVEGTVQQLMEPALRDQPHQVTARLVQNERLEFEEFTMAPVSRLEANLGEVDASNRPAFIREEDPQPFSQRDMGALEFVTDPLIADELMRIALYQSRWNTRTLQLSVRPGAGFKFFELGIGAPVNVDVSSEQIMGDRVGERTDPMRCVVAEPPRYEPDGSIRLVLQQQDEETFSEKYGLVFDYNDAGDVILLPPPPPPTEPPTCTPINRTFAPGHLITAADGLVVRAMGGTGRLTLGLAVERAPWLTINSTTGVVTGRVPAVKVDTTYRGRATATDEARRTGGCAFVLNVDAVEGDEPWIAISGNDGSHGGDPDDWRAVVAYPEVVSPPWAGSEPGDWRFTLAMRDPTATWARITSDGRGSSAPTSGTTTGAYKGTITATAQGYPSLTADITLVVRPVPTRPCTASGRTVRVRRNTPVVASGRTAIFEFVVDGPGFVEPLQVALVSGQSLPAGLAMSSTGELSGTCTAPARRYDLNALVTDSDSPVNTCATRMPFSIQVLEQRAVPTCTAAASTMGSRSGPLEVPVDIDGFVGTTTATLVESPDWLTVVDDAADPVVLRAGTGRTPGNYDWSLRITDTSGGTATCSGRITIAEDPVDPLTLADVRIETKEGEAYFGGLNPQGGVGNYGYFLEADPDGTDGPPQEAIGLSLRPGTGDFQGTAPEGPEAPGDYTFQGRVSSGQQEQTCKVYVKIIDVKTPPPIETECVGGEASGPPGVEMGVDIVTCTSPNTPLTSIKTTGPASWGAVWTDPETLTDPDLTPEGAGIAFSWSATPPAGTAVGEYRFTNTLRDSKGADTDVTIVATVTAARPLAIRDALMQIRQPASSAFRRQLVATGGDETAVASFSKVSGPGFLDINSSGLVTFPAQNAASSASWSVRVTRGTSTGTFTGTVEVWVGSGGGPTDPGDDEEPGTLI